MSIILLDRNSANVTFTKVNQTGNRVDFVAPGDTLLDAKSIALTLKQNRGTNRIAGKITVPTAHTNPSTGLPEVAYTEVGSFDLTAVRFASDADAENFLALLSSLIASPAVSGMYRTGAMPS